jgi:D-alanine-D-alanine ligase
MDMGDKVRVGLVYGGRSGEHEVSLQTAFSVLQAFDYDKYEIQPFYITKQGIWHAGPALSAPPEHIGLIRYDEADGSASEQLLLPVFERMAAPPKAPAAAAKAVQKAAPSASSGGSGGKRLDVVFPLLHGTYGEDGTIQGLLEMAGIPYVGAGVLASAVGMDKVMMKRVFAHEGLPQCVFRHFTRAQWDKDAQYFIMEIEVSLGYPCFVKPANLGSSVGISKAYNREQLIQAVEYAFRYDRKVLVEEFVNARELEVSVLGNDEPRASVVGEIVSSNDFYDYNAKYIDGKSVMKIPADIPEETAEQIREMALRAYQAIDGSGLARVDFFLRKEDGRIFLNEVNTMPGFTPFSMYPLLWKESGLPYRELLDKLIALAFERHEAKQKLVYGE